VDAFDAFEAAGWERQAAGYDDFFSPITTRLVGPLLDAARVGRGSRVLDVGSGPGSVAAGALERGATVVGVDVAEAMVALARQRVPGAEFVLGSADDLPFADGTFDAVVAGFALLHLGRPEVAVAEFARVLAPAGSLALTVWNTPDRARFIGVLVDALAAAGAAAPADIPAGPPIFRFADGAELAQLLAEFDAVLVETITFDWGFASADALWDGLLGGTVRVSALIDSQPPEMRERIRAELDRIVAREGLSLPVSVRLASASRP